MSMKLSRETAQVNVVVGGGEGRRGNTEHARCGNVAELSDVGPRTAADRGKWVAAVVAVVVVVVILAGPRIQQFSTPRQSSHILPPLFTLSPTRCHLSIYTTTLCRLVPYTAIHSSADYNEHHKIPSPQENIINDEY